MFFIFADDMTDDLGLKENEKKPQKTTTTKTTTNKQTKFGPTKI
jgi:hypothetical protein